MNSKTIHLLDLPDEILFIILNKLGSVDVLYSLLNITQRLNQIARSIDFIKSINFSIELSNGQFSTIDNDKIHRFSVEILPQIYHKIEAMTLEIVSMERILFACEYPNLSVIILIGVSANIVLHYLTEESSMSHLFKEQIKHITVKFADKVFTNETFTDACIHILSVCRKCSYLNMMRSRIRRRCRLSFYDPSPNICYSSHLHIFLIRVKNFDDCLCLFDGRLNQLSSFTVHVTFIKRSPVNTDSHISKG